MPRLFRRVQTEVAASPGTIKYSGVEISEPARIIVMDYDEAKLDEYDAADVGACVPLKESSTVSWINVDGIHDTRIIEEIGRGFGFHPLVLEDVVHVNQRPKIEDNGDYIFMVLRMLSQNPTDGRVQSEQVSILLGANYVITFQERSGDVFGPVRDRIRRGGRIRSSGADYLAYALIDALVDNYFVILEQFGERIETLDEEVASDAVPATLQRIHELKREMIFLRKPVWPVRELVDRLYRGDNPLIREKTGPFLRDVYDHVIQVIDVIDSYKEVVAGMQDLYLSAVSNRMNEVMKVLTIIATIFVPLTFVAGIYGMNFEHMPELGWKLGYPLFWVVVGSIATVLIIFFRKRRWL